MNNHKSLAQLFLLLVVLAGLVFPASLLAEQELSEYGNPFTMVTIGKVKVKAEVVTSPEKMYLGLGHRSSLPEGRGMLFILPKVEPQYFCMRDMQFPIDILWLASGRVAGVTSNISQLDPQATYGSPVPVQYVLELPGGFADRQGIQAGDKASW